MFLLFYPQYNHTHLFRKSYFDGGLTIDQFECLLKVAVKRENDNIRLKAALQGIEIPDEIDSEKAKKKIKSGGMFGSPEIYSEMTEGERNAADEKLMSMMKSMGLPIKKME